MLEFILLGIDALSPSEQESQGAITENIQDATYSVGVHDTGLKGLPKPEPHQQCDLETKSVLELRSIAADKLHIRVEVPASRAM
jgi:hypothetical protein